MLPWLGRSLFGAFAIDRCVSPAGVLQALDCHDKLGLSAVPFSV